MSFSNIKMWTPALLLVIGVSLVTGKVIETSEHEERQPKIFRGSYDVENRHKYHVAILQVLPDQTTQHICGGAIIDSHYVLTAAHCVYGLQKNELLVRSGPTKEPERPDLEKRVFHNVARVMYLQDYVLSSCRHHEHDIAIIKVVKQFDLADDKNIKKVSLPEPDNDYENYAATLTGYGVERIALRLNKTSDTLKKIFRYSEELKYFDTKVVPLEQCKQALPVIVTSKNLCTQERNPTGFSCIGDSGGPLVQDGVVIGIRNSHNNECDQGQHELYTRVSSYLQFIHKVLNRESSYEIVYV